MSVAIEINRSRIGSHHKFTQGIYILESNVDDFLFKSILLPFLKNLVTKTEKYNEVCMWYAQMVCYCYHVHVPLLLRLSKKY
jgi:hypothetical protein